MAQLNEIGIHIERLCRGIIERMNQSKGSKFSSQRMYELNEWQKYKWKKKNINDQ